MDGYMVQINQYEEVKSSNFTRTTPMEETEQLAGLHSVIR